MEQSQTKWNSHRQNGRVMDKIEKSQTKWKSHRQNGMVIDKMEQSQTKWNSHRQNIIVLYFVLLWHKWKTWLSIHFISINILQKDYLASSYKYSYKERTGLSLKMKSIMISTVLLVFFHPFLFYLEITKKEQNCLLELVTFHYAFNVILLYKKKIFFLTLYYTLNFYKHFICNFAAQTISF